MIENEQRKLYLSKITEQSISLTKGFYSLVTIHIMNQEEHHRIMSYAEEHEEFLRKHDAILNR